MVAMVTAVAVAPVAVAPVAVAPVAVAPVAVIGGTVVLGRGARVLVVGGPPVVVAVAVPAVVAVVTPVVAALAVLAVIGAGRAGRGGLVAVALVVAVLVAVLGRLIAAEPPRGVAVDAVVRVVAVVTTNVAATVTSGLRLGCRDAALTAAASSGASTVVLGSGSAVAVRSLRWRTGPATMAGSTVCRNRSTAWLLLALASSTPQTTATATNATIGRLCSLLTGFNSPSCFGPPGPVQTSLVGGGGRANEMDGPGGEMTRSD